METHPKGQGEINPMRDMETTTTVIRLRRKQEVKIKMRPQNDGGGGRTIRATRLRKSRKNYKFLLVILNTGFMWYLFMFAAISFPSSTTNALFVSQTTNKMTFRAGTWHKPSRLVFTGECGVDAKQIYIYIKKDGHGDMEQASKYDVYYLPKGNPAAHKEKLLVFQGEIPKMKANGAPVKLTYTPKQPGYYQFFSEKNAFSQVIHFTNEEMAKSKNEDGMTE